MNTHNNSVSFRLCFEISHNTYISLYISSFSFLYPLLTEYDSYDPSVIPEYFEDINDIPINKFQSTILVPTPKKAGDGYGLDAEATYSLPENKNLVRIDPPLPTEALNQKFMNGSAKGGPMVFLEANRSMVSSDLIL